MPDRTVGGARTPERTGRYGDSDGGAQLLDDQAAAADGVTLDRACVEPVAAQLSDEDAALTVSDPNTELSPKGEALGLELVTCADDEEIIDLIIVDLVDSGVPVDEDCARDELANFDVQELLATAGAGDDLPPELVTALTPCLAG